MGVLFIEREEHDDCVVVYTHYDDGSMDIDVDTIYVDNLPDGLDCPEPTEEEIEAERMLGMYTPARAPYAGELPF